MGAGHRDIFCQLWRPWPAGRGDGRPQPRGGRRSKAHDPCFPTHGCAVGVGGVTGLVWASDIKQPPGDLRLSPMKQEENEQVGTTVEERSMSLE